MCHVSRPQYKVRAPPCYCYQLDFLPRLLLQIIKKALMNTNAVDEKQVSPSKPNSMHGRRVPSFCRAWLKHAIVQLPQPHTFDNATHGESLRVFLYSFLLSFLPVRGLGVTPTPQAFGGRKLEYVVIFGPLSPLSRSLSFPAVVVTSFWLCFSVFFMFFHTLKS